MFKDLMENMKITRREMENMKKNQMELLEQKIQYLKGRAHFSRLDIVEEKNSEIEDLEIKYT